MEDNSQKRLLQDLILIMLGCILYGCSMVFLAGIPTIPGNLMGVAAVCNTLFGWSTGLVNFILSVPTIIIGTFVLGRRMLVYTAISMAGISVMTDVCTSIAAVDAFGSTTMYLLYTVVAGCIMGIGSGFIMYVGGTLGGTTIFGRILVKKTPKISLGMWLTIMDVLIMAGGALALKDIRSFTFSVLFEIVCCKAIDVVLVLMKKVLPPRW